ncbi:hypothetical protein [Winogradskyella immobilis]|uniref:Uncharacterized protein n=1 Tax=Winogradskyella immobilis TaxID=2816852 RepID=A0ABS8EMD1_9FLAO|nr:hypothetical protein [Winogradskyella immobilis]MCC1484375.1 hypothetical protein [Winogradskyella immobilis]MCG0016467.1 hypothetical protein [Winogradskyella immobilis]
MKNLKRILLLLCLVGALGMNAQKKNKQTVDYTEQIEAFKQCFKDRSGDKLKPYLSSDIAFPPFLPKEHVTPDRIDNVLSQLFTKQLNSMEVKKSKPGKVTIAYNIVGAGKRKSAYYLMMKAKLLK